MPEGAVIEDDRPLRPGSSPDALAPGEYFIWRDEVRFTSSDGSDPRENGRLYSVLMPQCVAALERLPLDEVLRKGM